MSAQEAVRDISLKGWADWGGAERIVVNVDHFYREFSGDKSEKYLFQYIEQMVPIAKRAKR
jgi:hypothetical protein